jgi:hypothetical protein
MIYTCITNEKDKPRNDVKMVEGLGLFKNPRRDARMIKVLSHKFIDDEYSIWVDGNVFLRKNEREYYKLLGNKDIAVIDHPQRNCIYDEALACIKLEKDNDRIIVEQVGKYKDEGFKDNKLAQTSIVIRRRTPELMRLENAWWAEICRYSYRDQLSFPYVFGDRAVYLPVKDHDDNEYFERLSH